MSSRPTVTITAKYVWDLIFDYDNSGNAGEITHTYEFEQSGSYTATTFNETVSEETRKLAESGSIEVEAGVSYGPFSSSVKSGYEMSKSIDSMLQETTRQQSEKVITWSTKETREYKIGPHSRLVLYQRNLYGPGMRVQDSALRTTPVPLSQQELTQEVPIDVVLEPKVFVKSLKVVYGDQSIQAPGDRVRDWFKGSDDINYGFEGKYVWLVPETTTQVSEALTTFDLVIQPQYDERYPDLAVGAGGSYRYLIPVRQSNQKLFISDVTLARSNDWIYPSLSTMVWPDLPQGATQDINAGRGGTYLFLVFQLQRVYTV